MIKPLADVITAVEACDEDYFVNCAVCPYYADERCKQRLQNDILTYLNVLKEEFGYVSPGVRMIKRK